MQNLDSRKKFSRGFTPTPERPVRPAYRQAGKRGDSPPHLNSIIKYTADQYNAYKCGGKWLIIRGAQPQSHGRKPVAWGFTLVEVALVAGILGIISIALANFMAQYWRSADFMTAQISLQSEGRNAVSKMTDDLRKTNQASTGAYAIETATASSIAFYANIDIDSYFEKVRYFVIGTELRRGTIKPGGNPLSYNPVNETFQVLSKNAANGASPMFQYYDNTFNGAGLPLASPVDVTKIRFVKINVILDNDISSEPAPVSVEAAVNLRNLNSD